MMPIVGPYKSFLIKEYCKINIVKEVFDKE